MRRPSLIRRFFSFLLKVVVVLILMVIIAAAAFEGVTYYLTGSLYDLRELVLGDTISEIAESNSDDTDSEIDVEIDETDMRNTLMFVDDETTDTEYIVLNMLNTQTYVLDVLLVPANAQVTVGKTVLTDIQEVLSDAEKTVTLSEISRAFGSQKYDMITEILESVTGISISGYDVMNDDDFMDFLNLVDAVEYQLDYSITYRDDGGVLQVIDEETEELDSEQAMQLIRYLDGTETEETTRLENTSAYLQAYLQQLFDENSASTIYKKYVNLISSGGGRDLTDEESMIENLESDNIVVRIMQGSESSGVFSIDSEKVQVQISSLIKQTEAADTSDSSGGDSATDSDDDTGTTSAVDSREYSLELYNSAYVSGLAAEWEEYLEEEGYTITLVDSYQDEGPLSTTRIVVTEEGMGEDLLEYFPNATISVDDIDTGGDIQVYIGTDSTNVGSSSDDAESEEETEESEEETSGEDDSNGSYSFDTDSEG